MISDTSLTADAQALEKGYKGNALFASLNQNSSHALDEAIRQISGRNSGMSNLQVRRLDNRFRQALSDEIRSPSGAGFNVISRYTPQGNWGVAVSLIWSHSVRNSLTDRQAILYRTVSQT